MNKRKFGYKCLALATAFVCAVSGPASAVTVNAATIGSGQSWKSDVTAGEAAVEMDVVKILTVEDLQLLAKECVLDEWSANKRVVLEADLDLSGSDFTGIATFGGIFDGQGHTISGFSYTESGNVNGFFRYVREGGTVKDLTVEGEVKPGEHKDTTGGLAGNNKGLITGCSFIGTVEGKDKVGGIAGINEATGQVINCSFEGDMTGEHYVGGIVGENLGSIVRSKNLGAINTTEVKATTEILDSEPDDSVLQLLSSENMPAVTDVGGIAGASSGILQSCENAGEIGYPHTGYNIGGIVGRQSGYLDGCVNSGTINGRKDVGGIVGQFEPNVTLQFEQGQFENLWTELEVLQGLIDVTIQDAKGVSSAISNSMHGLSDSAQGMKDATSGLTDSLTDWADSNLETINDFSARLSWALDQMKPVGADLEEALKLMGTASGQLSDALEEGKLAMELGSSAIGELSGAFEKIISAVDSAKAALEHMRAAAEMLGNAIGDNEAVQAAIKKLADGCEELGKAFDEIAGGLDAAVSALRASSSGNAQIERLCDRLESLADASRTFGSAMKRVAEGLRKLTVSEEGITGLAELSSAAMEVQTAGTQLENAGRSVASALSALETGQESPAEDAYLKVSEQMAGLEGMLEEAVALMENGGRAPKDTAGELADKLQEILKGASDMESALDALEQAAGSGTGTKDLVSEVDNARAQLEKIKSTAQGMLSVLEEAGELPDTAESPEEEEESGATEETESSEEETESTEEESTAGAEESTDPESSAKTPEESAEESTTEESPAEEEGAVPVALDEEPGGFAYFSKETQKSASASEESSSESGTGSEPPSDSESTSESPSESGTGSETPSEPESGEDIFDVWKGVLEEWKAARSDLEAAMKSLRKSLDGMKAFLDKLEEAGNHAAGMSGTLSKAASSLKESFGEIASAASGIRTTIAKLADQPAIQFTPLSSGVTQKKDELDVALDDMSLQIENLGDVMDYASDVLLDDMEAINEQFGVIIRVLKGTAAEQEEIIEEEHIEDISDEEEEEDLTDGCVSNSVNEGEIQGDVNVAGIVGAMAIEYDFDPEDDLNRVGETSTDFSWLTSAVLTGCKNIGEVTAKKDCAGGIVGRMDMGKVSDCESYGEVVSSSGNYVGGIAGASWATIRDSWAKCSLSGTDYIGGIAGYGKTITGCRSLVEIAEGSAFKGAIAGNADMDGEIRENVYVHDSLAAIDGISYAQKAEPISFDELLSDSAAPEKFREFELTFVADDEVVGVKEFQYGKGIDSLPEIPAKEGYFAKWPDIDYSHLTFSQTLEAEYIAYESAISDGGEIPEILVDGTFSNEASIEHTSQEMAFTDEKGREHTGTAVTVRVTDPVLSEISYTIHYRLPDEGGSYRLWAQTASGWEKTDYEMDGEYLLLKNDGKEVTFLLEEYSTTWLVVTAAVAAVLLVAVLILARKRSGKKKKAKKAGEPVSEA